MFGASVYTLKGTKNATCLGGAYIARHGMVGSHYYNLQPTCCYSTQHISVTITTGIASSLIA